MLRKAFEVRVELDVHAVTCPGVWLCPNGRVSLQLRALGSSVRTSSIEPVFPLLFRRRFVFWKRFTGAQRLSALQKALNKEGLYAELIQWQEREVGNVLAVFRTTLGELLFPGGRGGTMAGLDVDLLMEPMKNFPGILAPKIEVSTRTTITDRVCSEEDPYVVNPQVLPSKRALPAAGEKRQRAVCHSINYHRSRKCSTHCKDAEQTRPPFAFRRVDDDLITRKPEDVEAVGTCQCKTSPRKRPPSKLPVRSPERRVLCMKNERTCHCSGDHTRDNCPVCSKYEHYFGDDVPCLKSKSIQDSEKLCNYPPSLARRIHDRLRDALEDCSRPAECECVSSDEGCTTSSFGDFYRDLYRRTRARCDKYVACE